MPLAVVLFGAFDRHNLGDLLLAHVAAALLPGRELVFAGLAERDLRGVGGHWVHGLARLAAAWPSQPAHLVHVGGEILTCDAWQAAAMLLPPDEAPATIAYLADRPRQRQAWAGRRLGLSARAPYVASRLKYPGLRKVIHAGTGGVDLDRMAPALRREVLADLGCADAVAVRERRTQALLAAAGLDARLVPDPAVMVAALLGERIRARAGVLAPLRDAWPGGYLAVQFSADFGDDATLAQIAGQLDEACAAANCGAVLFRAGAAPWHDDLAVLHRAVARMRSGRAGVFESLDLWDLCALIAHSRAYCGSSLHGRIVALAFGLPRISLRRPGAAPGKQAAFAASWDDGLPVDVDPGRIGAAIGDALAADPGQLRALADRLAARYRLDAEAIYRDLP
jgi:hypothetical protein